MKWFDLTFDTPAENLACDEALLDLCEGDGVEMLRFKAWCRGLDRRSMPDADRFDFSIATLAIVIWI